MAVCHYVEEARENQIGKNKRPHKIRNHPEQDYDAAVVQICYHLEQCHDPCALPLIPYPTKQLFPFLDSPQPCAGNLSIKKSSYNQNFPITTK